MKFSQQELIIKVLNGEKFTILTTHKLGYCKDRGLIVENENDSNYTASYRELQSVKRELK